MPKVLGIIPARGGSKGIPGKNLIDVGGRPLIGWSIASGLELVRLGALERAVVSTDSAQIAEVARSLGADVPFIRPANLAGDSSKAIEYVIHALDFFGSEGTEFDAVVILQPTCPRRDAIAIHDAIRRFFELGMDSMISCYEDDYLGDSVLYRFDQDRSFAQPSSREHSLGNRRQESPSVLVRTGVLYMTTTQFLRSQLKIISDRPGVFLVSKLDAINVDTLEDLHLLRATF